MKNSSPKSLLADCRYTVGQLSAGSIPTVDQQQTDTYLYWLHIYYPAMWLCRGPAGGGSPMSPIWILKHLVSVFINACHLLSALMSLSQFGRGRLSLVAISFYTLLLLFGPCRLSEFTLAGPIYTNLALWLCGYAGRCQLMWVCAYMPTTHFTYCHVVIVLESCIKRGGNCL